MGRFSTLKKSGEFGYIYNNSKKSHSNYFILFYKRANQKKIGFTASKKVGNAVKRNFAKRRLRSLFLEFEESILDGSYILVAKKQILDAPFLEVKKSLNFSLKKVSAIDNNAKKNNFKNH
ncbi:MAG: ribonuclease P protein component [Sulfurospirillum sp.]|nr:MAG: ribonuclease P protein component [Sulfurospirillum sp.]